MEENLSLCSEGKKNAFYFILPLLIPDLILFVPFYSLSSAIAWPQKPFYLSG